MIPSSESNEYGGSPAPESSRLAIADLGQPRRRPARTLDDQPKREHRRCLEQVPRVGQEQGRPEVLARLALRAEIRATCTRRASFEPRSRTRTRYLAVPRTCATTSPGRAAITVTRPLTKYDWPRARTASLKFRETFWAIPIICSRSGWAMVVASWRGGRRVDPRRSMDRQIARSFIRDPRGRAATAPRDRLGLDLGASSQRIGLQDSESPDSRTAGHESRWVQRHHGIWNLSISNRFRSLLPDSARVCETRLTRPGS